MTAVSLKLVFSKSDTRRVSLRGPSQSMFDQLIDHVKAILIAKNESSEFSLLHAGDGNVVQRIASPEQLMRAIQAAETTGKHLKLTVDLPHAVNASPPTPAPPSVMASATAPASPMLQPMPPSTPPTSLPPLAPSAAAVSRTPNIHNPNVIISAPSQSPHLHTTLSMGHIPHSSSIPMSSTPIHIPSGWSTPGHSASMPYTHIPSSPAGHPPAHPHPPSTMHHTPQRVPIPPLTWPPPLHPNGTGSAHASPTPSPSSSTAPQQGMWSMPQPSPPTNRATVVISSPVSSWNYHNATAPPVVVAAPMNVTQPSSSPSYVTAPQQQDGAIKLGTESQSIYHAHMLTWLPVTTDERHCDVCIGDLGTRAWQCTTGACDFHICASCRSRESGSSTPTTTANTPVPVMATPAVNAPTRVAMATAVPTTPVPTAVAAPPIPVTPAMVVISMPQSAPTPAPSVVNPTPASSATASSSSSSSSSSPPMPTPGVPSSRNHRGSITEEQRPRLNLSPEDEARELQSIRRDLAAVLGEVAQPSITHLDNTSPFDEVCLKHIRRNLNTFEDYYLGMCKDFSGRQSRCKMVYTERLQAIKLKYERVVMGESVDDSKDGKESKDSKDSKQETKVAKKSSATAATESKRITPITVSSVAMEWKECREEYARELERINTRFQRRVDVLVTRYDKHMQDMAANSFLLPISLTLSIAHRPISFEVMMGSTDTLGDVRELLEEKMRELGDPIADYSPAQRWAISTPVSTAIAMASQPRSGTAGVVNAVVNSIHGAAVSVANPSSSSIPTPAPSPPAAAAAASSSIWSLFGGGGNAPVEQPKSPIVSPQPTPDEPLVPSGKDGSRSPVMSKRHLNSPSSAAGSSAASIPVAPTAATSGFGRFLGSLAAVGKSGLQTVGKKIADQTELKPEPRVFVVDGRDDFLSLSELRITAKSTITLLGGVRLQSEAPLCVMYRSHALLQAASSDHFVCVQCDLKYICAQCVISCHQGHQVAIVDEGADAAASSAGGAKKSGLIDKKSVALASGSAAAAGAASAPQPSTKKMQCDCGVPRPPQMARHPLHPHPCRRVVRSVTAESPSPWICDGCDKEGDDAAGRFRCVEGCQNFDLCLACWSSEVAEPPPHICSFAPKPKPRSNNNNNNNPPLPATTPTGNGIVASKKPLAPSGVVSIGGEDQIEGSGEAPSAPAPAASGDGLPSSIPVVKRRPSTGPRPPATPPIGMPHGSPHHGGNNGSGAHDHIPPMSLPAASPTGAHVVVHHNMYPGQAHVLITPSPSAASSAVAAAVASGGNNYDSALKQLAEMGFNDSALNLRYLRQKNGNVDAVLQLLLTMPNT